MAHVMMQMFEMVWKARLKGAGVVTWLLPRYMDDALAFLPPIRAGWRWGGNGLQFSQKWVVEDVNKTPTQLTKDVLAGSMKGIEGFLEFTFETCEDFENGWLPTLDTCLRVEQDNSVSINYYEKDTCNNMTVHCSIKICNE